MITSIIESKSAASTMFACIKTRIGKKQTNVSVYVCIGGLHIALSVSNMHIGKRVFIFYGWIFIGT